MSNSFDHAVDLTTIAAILFDECDDPSKLSAKAFHKITYFIDKNLREQGTETELAYFWYKFGTMTITRRSPVIIDRSGAGRSKVVCTITPDELSLSKDLERTVRESTQAVLTDHEELGTEGLTDRMYSDAPYEFQREYRRLDSTIQDQLQNMDGSKTSFNREAIRTHIHAFIDEFPEEDFPEYQNDLYLWYDILSNRLNNSGTTLEAIEDEVELFWTIVMIDLATHPSTGVDVEAFGGELGIDNPDGFQQYLRSELYRLEDEHLRVSDPPESTIAAADAVMASQLDFVSQ